MTDDGTLLLERDEGGLYEITLPLSSLRTDWQGIVRFADLLKKLVVDGKGPAIYVIRFGEDECSDDT